MIGPIIKPTSRDQVRWSKLVAAATEIVFDESKSAQDELRVCVSQFVVSEKKPCVYLYIFSDLVSH